MPYLRRGALALLAIVLLAAAIACGGGGSSSSTPTQPAPATAAPAVTPAAQAPDNGLVGKPQARTGLGDAEGAFARYADSRGELIDLIKAQDWYKDGLTKEESLFVERMLTYVARMGGPRTGYISDVTVRQKLFLYDKATTKTGEVDLILIFEPNQDAAREMA